MGVVVQVVDDDFDQPFVLRPLLERFRPTVLIETGGENRPQIVALFTTLGYAGFTLDRGREIPLTPDTTKDIIFRHAH